MWVIEKRMDTDHISYRFSFELLAFVRKEQNTNSTLLSLTLVPTSLLTISDYRAFECLKFNLQHVGCLTTFRD